MVDEVEDAEHDDAVDPAAETQLPLPPPPVLDARAIELSRARVRAALLDVPTVAPRFGRYVLLHRLGRGGMGVVYAAHDPQLDRKVAIKVVSAARAELAGDRAQRRLEREARAVAALAHPNVVTVHDVGHADGRLYVAMELVDGETLTAWMGPRRPWTEAVAMFVAIGRGLAAAHDAGLVHRDFKPDNVLIGRDGRPRVADFGLARAIVAPPSLDRRRTDDGHGGSDDSGSGPATTAGLAGTPRYMSPEQWTGSRVGPRSDQFSFCLVLAEALLGRRPTVAPSRDEANGALRIDIPRGSGIPRPLVAVLEQGLRPEPDQRHRDMHRVVSALERVLHRRRRLVLGALGVVASTLALGIGYQVATATQPGPCDDVGEALAASWSDERRETVRRALASLPEPRSTGALAALDDYAAQWVGARRDACEATRVRAEHSELAEQLRLSCLDRHAGRLRGLVAELTAGGDLSWVDDTLVERWLPPVSACEDVQVLARQFNRFDGESSRDSVAQDRAAADAHELLLRAELQRRRGEPTARELAEQARGIAQEHGLSRLHAQALQILADLESGAGNRDAAQALYVESLHHAVAGGDDAQVADLVLVRADAAAEAGRLGETEAHLSYLEAFVPRVPEATRRRSLEAKADQIRARIALHQGRYEDVLSLLDPAVTLMAEGVLPEYDQRSVLFARATAAKALGHVDEAVASYERLLGIDERLLGPTHPSVGIVLNNLANVHPDPQEAVRLAGRARAVLAEALGSDSPSVTSVIDTLAQAERRAGRLDDARRHQLEVLERLRAQHGGDHPSMADAHDQLSLIVEAAGDTAGAAEHAERARALRAEPQSDDPPGKVVD